MDDLEAIKQLKARYMRTETYERIGGDWRIKTCLFKELRADFTPPSA